MMSPMEAAARGGFVSADGQQLPAPANFEAVHTARIQESKALRTVEEARHRLQEFYRRAEAAGIVYQADGSVSATDYIQNYTREAEQAYAELRPIILEWTRSAQSVIHPAEEYVAYLCPRGDGLLPAEFQKLIELAERNRISQFEDVAVVMNCLTDFVWGAWAARILSNRSHEAELSGLVESAPMLGWKDDKVMKILKYILARAASWNSRVEKLLVGVEIVPGSSLKPALSSKLKVLLSEAKRVPVICRLEQYVATLLSPGASRKRPAPEEESKPAPSQKEASADGATDSSIRRPPAKQIRSEACGKTGASSSIIGMTSFLLLLGLLRPLKTTFALSICLCRVSQGRCHLSDEYRRISSSSSRKWRGILLCRRSFAG